MTTPTLNAFCKYNDIITVLPPYVMNWVPETPIRDI